jgi:3,4-dihydroxy 2-butanone 4-phosphate synthase/GTP cyclohydrolase II
MFPLRSKRFAPDEYRRNRREDRGNEGDLTLAAEKLLPKPSTSWLSTDAAYLPGYDRRTSRPPAHRSHDQRKHIAIRNRFCEAIDARAADHGISATIARIPKVAPSRRAHRIWHAPGTCSAASPGGVLGSAGQTEASVDLGRLAGMVPAGIICEIMKDDGTMARVPDLMSSAAPRNEDAHGCRVDPLPDEA